MDRSGAKKEKLLTFVPLPCGDFNQVLLLGGDPSAAILRCFDS